MDSKSTPKHKYAQKFHFPKTEHKPQSRPSQVRPPNTETKNQTTTKPNNINHSIISHGSHSSLEVLENNAKVTRKWRETISTNMPSSNSTQNYNSNNAVIEPFDPKNNNDTSYDNLKRKTNENQQYLQVQINKIQNTVNQTQLENIIKERDTYYQEVQFMKKNELTLKSLSQKKMGDLQAELQLLINQNQKQVGQLKQLGQSESAYNEMIQENTFLRQSVQDKDEIIQAALSQKNDLEINQKTIIEEYENLSQILSKINNAEKGLIYDGLKNLENECFKRDSVLINERTSSNKIIQDLQDKLLQCQKELSDMKQIFDGQKADNDRFRFIIRAENDKLENLLKTEKICVGELEKVIDEKNQKLKDFEEKLEAIGRQDNTRSHIFLLGSCENGNNLESTINLRDNYALGETGISDDNEFKFSEKDIEMHQNKSENKAQLADKTMLEDKNDELNNRLLTLTEQFGYIKKTVDDKTGEINQLTKKLEMSEQKRQEDKNKLNITYEAQIDELEIILCDKQAKIRELQRGKMIESKELDKLTMSVCNSDKETSIENLKDHQKDRSILSPNKNRKIYETDKEIALQTVIRLKNDIENLEYELFSYKEENQKLVIENIELLGITQKNNNDASTMLIRFAKFGKEKHTINQVMDDLNISEEELKEKLDQARKELIFCEAYIDGFQKMLNNFL